VNDLSIHTLVVMPRSEHLVVAGRCGTVFIFSLSGQLLKAMGVDKKGVDFISVVPSRQGKFVFGLAEDNQLYCFNVKEGRVEASFQVGGGGGGLKLAGA
jgi:hypothetical protein